MSDEVTKIEPVCLCPRCWLEHGLREANRRSAVRATDEHSTTLQEAWARGDAFSDALAFAESAMRQALDALDKEFGHHPRQPVTHGLPAFRPGPKKTTHVVIPLPRDPAVAAICERAYEDGKRAGARARAALSCTACRRPLPPPAEGCCSLCGVPYDRSLAE